MTCYQSIFGFGMFRGLGFHMCRGSGVSGPRVVVEGSGLSGLEAKGSGRCAPLKRSLPTKSRFVSPCSMHLQEALGVACQN